MSGTTWKLKGTVRTTLITWLCKEITTSEGCTYYFPNITGLLLLYYIVHKGKALPVILGALPLFSLKRY